MKYKDYTVADLDLLSPGDLGMIASWNRGKALDASRYCIHELIHEICLAQPDQPAVYSWDGKFSYRQLDILSSGLAAHLGRFNVKPEVFVPLCFEKSKWTIIAMLGVLKAGGAFVLLDPSYPIKRLQEICHDLNAKVVLSSVKNGVFSRKLANEVISIGNESILWNNDEPYEAVVRPDNAAYTVFTSGSTGRAKGVVIEHASFCTSAKAHGEALFLDSTARVLQMSSYAFDVSISDILTTLIMGGCVCVPSETERISNISKTINQLQVNWVHITPSISRLLSPEEVPTIKIMILIGESMSHEDIAIWAGRVHLICSYGPAECSVVSTVQSVIAQSSDPRNIGYGTGCVTWVVDKGDHHRLAPIGTVGELLIDGPIVGRGYLNEHEKTEAAFIESPRWLRHFRAPGAWYSGRLYRTGDLVRYNSNGSIKYLGRTDTQVKVRGQRVELEEVEIHVQQSFRGAKSVIVELIPILGSSHPSLAAFVFCENERYDVKTDELGSHEKTSQAGLFAASNSPFRSEVLRAESLLRNVVSSSMLPSIFIQITHIPLMKTGKADRRKLKEHASKLAWNELSAYWSSTAKRLPLTQIERIFQNIFARTLGLEQDSIGIDDQFFRLGGDSLTAMKMVREARKDGLEFTVGEIFKYPTVSELARAAHASPEHCIQTIAPFSLLQNGEDLGKTCQLAIAQCGKALSCIQDIYPCTPLQEGLIALTAKKPALYVGRFVYRLRKETDLDRFRAAWEATFQANDILRTRIIQNDSKEMLQAVVQDSINWETSSNLNAYILQDSTRATQLGGKLVRFAIVKQNDLDSSLFVLTLHHALYDGWSLPLILEQVGASYKGNKLQAKPFSPFIQSLSNLKHLAWKAFWRAQFIDLQTMTFPALPSNTYAPTAITMLEHLVTFIEGTKTNFTISTMIRLAWAIVLAQHTDSNDVVFGVTVAGRATLMTGIEEVTGPTIATLPFRVQIQLDETIEDGLKAVQDSATAMIPFEQTGLQNIRCSGADASTACQFQNLLVIQPSSEENDLELLTLEEQDLKSQGAFTNYSLTVECQPGAGYLRIHAKFDPDVITETQVWRVLRQLSHVFKQVEKSVDMKIRDVVTLSPEDILQLNRWNQDLPRRREVCVHDRIKQQCTAYPDIQAVDSWDGSFTYRDLDELSSRLASHLQYLGVGPEMIVPLCFDKGKWITVAMLGVMKAGGAFVLLDPSHPILRLQEICKDIKATLILSSTQYTATGMLLTENILVVSEKENVWRDQCCFAQSLVKSHNALYAVFTSGTTGKPKGVIIEHGTYCAAAEYHSKALCLDNASRVFQFSSYAFDASVSDHLSTWMVGGCVCIPSEAERNNSLSLAISRYKANWIFLTPSLSKLISPEVVWCVQTMIIGGEQISRAHVDIWKDRLRLITAYGPAECTTYSTAQLICNAPQSTSSTSHSDIKKKSNFFPIGQGLGAILWIVDKSDPNKLTPIGAVGELLIEGPIVGRGYINNVEETLKSFIEPPTWLRNFRGEGILERLYKTGDLVQYCSDGSIKFIGRKDAQVKLRGQRIELEEVEFYIRLHFSGMKDVIVEVLKNVNPILAAFIHYEPDSSNVGTNFPSHHSIFSGVPSDGFRSKAQEVKSKLYDSLPKYAVPAVFIPMVYVPFTRTGKIDRRRVVEQASKLSKKELLIYSTALPEKRLPSTEKEKMLQRLWAKTLDITFNTIGADDNFFHLGGDSIGAMKLVGISREEGLRLTVANIFNHPNLSDLALYAQEVLDTAQIAALTLVGSNDAQESIKKAAVDQCGIALDEVEDIYPCTPLQEGLMALTVKRGSSYVAQVVYQLVEDIDLDRFISAWKATVEANPILRTRIIHTESAGLFQVVIKDEVCLKSEEDLDAYLDQDFRQLMHPGQGLVRSAIIRRQSNGCFFVLTLHHALYDGWSVPLLKEQIEDAYKGLNLEKRPFNGFIKYLSLIDAAELERFWRSEFSNLKAVAFPAISAISDRPTYGYDPVTTRSLEHSIPIIPKAGNEYTASSIIKLAWAIVLSRYTDSTDVVFGNTVTGRYAPVVGIERMTGPTIATVPLRIQLQPDMTCKEALRSVQNHSIEMIPFEQMGLQNISRLGTDAAAACKFQNLLIVQPYEEVKAAELFASEIDDTYNRTASETYPLRLLFQLEPKFIKVEVTFNAQFIVEEQMRRMLHQFCHVFSQILEESILIKDIEVLSPDDISQLRLWNSKTPERTRDCVHVLIQKQCLKQPKALAASAWDGHLSYGEVEDLSSRMAIQLMSKGAGPEMFIPICFEKSVWLVVAMLGVMKSGAAFVLLDPSYPLRRLQDICQQIRAKIIVSSAQHAKLSAALTVTSLILGASVSSWPKDAGKSINFLASPENAAYAVFTSGSTGTPKGVIIEHASFCSSAKAHGQAMFLNHKSRVFQFASYAFDISISDHLTTLIFGGTVCIPSDFDRKNDLAKSINTLQANWVTLTPSTIRLLRPRDIPTVQTMVLGGETMSKADITTWADKIHLICTYGPAECSVKSVIRSKINPDSDPHDIGYPAGCLCWVVDKSNHHKLAAIGTVGELLIEGPIVGREYINDLDKSQAAFVENPAWLFQFRETGQGRFYKTGDLVYQGSDGSLKFVERKDTQIKLRGQRIDLQEVEYHVRRCFSEAKEVVVEVLNINNPLLAAFIWSENYRGNEDEDYSLRKDSERTMHTSSLASSNEEFQSETVRVRSRLLGILPNFMIPSIFIPLNYIPLTITGKINRRELREQASSLTNHRLQALNSVQRFKRKPSTKAEENLQALWVRALCMPPDEVGVDDNFFYLGGDSIVAMRLAGMARENGFEVAVAQIFNFPHLSDLAKVMRPISNHAARVIEPFSLLDDEKMQESLRQVAVQQCKIKLDNIEDIYPCTALQEGLMALTVKKRGAYIARLVYDLPRRVNVDAFKVAWEATFNANAILRTRIIQTENGRMFQTVVSAGMTNGIKWRPDKNSLDLDGYLSLDCQQSMNIGEALTRFAIVKKSRETHNGDREENEEQKEREKKKIKQRQTSTEKGQYTLVLTWHHAVYDGWSLPLLLEQVEMAYHGSLLITKPFNFFVDYICQLDSTASARFWHSEFLGFNTAAFPVLPSAAYDPSPTSFVEYQTILKQTETEHTISTMIRLAWALILTKYTDTDDIVFGTTVTGRSAPIMGIETITGPTVATIPIRIRPQSHQTVRQMLQAAQDRWTAIMCFEQMGLQNIRRLGPEALTACSFQNMLVIQQAAEVSTSGIFTEQKPTSYNNAAFGSLPLTLLCQLKTGSLEIQASFDEQVIRKEQMHSLIRQFMYVLQQLQDKPNCLIKDIDFLCPDDILKLRKWNGHVPQRLDLLVHDLILQQCQAEPDAPAVCSWDGEFTYSELSKLSASLATYLVSLGVVPETIVPLCFEKSRWTTVAIMAVMRAGGAFVLLEPSHPHRRLQDICRAVSAKLLISSTKCMSLGAQLVNRVITLSENDLTWDQIREFQFESMVTPRNTLYVVFTSGSTGAPKGIVVEHAAYCTNAKAHIEAMYVTRNSRLLQFSSYAFDASISENLSTLIAGGCICVPSDTERNDLPKAVNRFQANWALLTPSVVRLLQPADVPSLEVLVLVGELMSQTEIATWAQQVHLICAYGPAECSAVCTVQSMGSDSNPVIIGRGVGASCWITDKDNHNALMPVGTIGELLIEGPILGREYIGEPGKTQAAFIENPHWLQYFRLGGLGRLYKTGDLVQYDSDGSLHFLGRKDNQVKLRGQRIELGEVEYQVRQYFGQAQDIVAEVIVPVDGDAKKILVAFIWLEHDRSEDISINLFRAPNTDFIAKSLKVVSKLQAVLPDYMIPGLFIALNRMPLTTTGKVDRNKLRKRASGFSAEELTAYTTLKTEKSPPQSEMEKKLHSIFINVLNLRSQVGVDDSFFSLGGDSITAMQVTSRCRSENIKLSVHDIFRKKTISGLASCAEIVMQSPVTIKDEELGKPFRLSPIQQLFLDTTPQGYDHFNQSFFLRLNQTTTIQALIKAFETLIKCHSMLRARFQCGLGSVWSQVITKDIKGSYRHHEHEVENQEGIEKVILASQKSLDILNGPLVSFELITLKKESQFLLIVAHHLVVDAVSWRIILEDLEGILRTGKLSSKPALSFQAWCHMQELYALENLDPSKTLPFNVSTPSETDYWSMADQPNTYDDILREDILLGKDVTRTLFEECNKAFRTQPVELFHAIILQSFANVFNDRALPILYNEAHGREPWDSSIDLSRVVGWFTTVWPTEVSVENRSDMLEFVRCTKDSRRKVSGNGWPYFTSQYLNSENKKRVGMNGASIEILFNYVGLYQQLEQKDSILQQTSLAKDGYDVGKGLQRFGLINISALVKDGCLHFSFAYNRHMRHQSEIRRWIHECKQSLEKAVQVLPYTAPSHTLTDFPLLTLNYRELAIFENQIMTSLKVTNPNEIESVYPTSPIQQGMLLSQARSPQNYLIRSIWEVSAVDNLHRVDLNRLQRAWQEVVSRHAMLRTVFIEGLTRKGYFDQVVLRKISNEALILKCENDNALLTLSKHHSTVSTKNQTPYQLALCKTSTGKLYCKFEFSHALIDAVSMGILINDFSLAYDEKLPTSQGPLYSNYIAHIQGSPRTLDLEECKAYLANIEPCLFPCLYDKQKGDSDFRQLKSLTIDLEAAPMLHKFSRGTGITVSNFLQVAWGMTLRSYIGSDTICFGYLVSGRDVPLENVEKTIGPFMNMFVCCKNIDNDTSLLQLLRENQEDFVRNLTYHHWSLAEIFHSIDIPIQRVFNTVISVQNLTLNSIVDNFSILFDKVDGQDPTEVRL